jgi:hypothetical protein
LPQDPVSTNLFSCLVKVKAGSDELVTLFGTRDESLPPMRDAVGNLANRFWIVVVVRQQRLGTLPDVDSAGVSFL